MSRGSKKCEESNVTCIYKLKNLVYKSINNNFLLLIHDWNKLGESGIIHPFNFLGNSVRIRNTI